MEKSSLIVFILDVLFNFNLNSELMIEVKIFFIRSMIEVKVVL